MAPIFSCKDSIILRRSNKIMKKILAEKLYANDDRSKEYLHKILNENPFLHLTMFQTAFIPLGLRRAFE